MGMIPKYGELRKLSDQDLIERYDSEAQHTTVGTSFYLDEMARRAMERQTRDMLDFTKHVRDLTVFIAILTVLNAVLVAVSLAQ